MSVDRIYFPNVFVLFILLFGSRYNSCSFALDLMLFKSKLEKSSAAFPFIPGYLFPHLPLARPNAGVGV